MWQLHQMQNPPPCKQAVIYNQDDLSDYAAKGGSVIDLFNQELNAHRSIVVIQTPANAPTSVLAVLNTVADIEDRKRARANVQDVLSKLLEGTADR